MSNCNKTTLKTGHDQACLHCSTDFSAKDLGLVSGPLAFRFLFFYSYPFFFNKTGLGHCEPSLVPHLSRKVRRVRGVGGPFLRSYLVAPREGCWNRYDSMISTPPTLFAGTSSLF